MRRLIFSIITLTLTLLSFGVFAPTAQAQDTADFAYAQTFATVINANALNIRTAPTTSAGVMAVAPAGAVYPVLAKTADSGWWQIAIPPFGYVGWVSGWFLSIPNQHLVPVVTPSPAYVPNTPLGVVNTANLNVRAIPDPYVGTILTTIQLGQAYPIIGKNGSGTPWYQISLPNGGNGWVNAKYLFDANASGVPVTHVNQPTPQPTAYGTVTAYFLNVRSTPNPFIFNILAVIARGQTYAVIGRNAAGTWYQINLGNGIVGWVNGTYFAVTNGVGLPITG